jgi:hypothetical protein
VLGRRIRTAKPEGMHHKGSVPMIQSWKTSSLSHLFGQTPPQFSTQVLPRSKDDGIQQKQEIQEDFTKK